MPIPLVGLEYLTKNLNGVDDVVFGYMATTADATAFSDSDTALVAENTLYGSARKAATCTFVAPGTARFNALFSFTGDVTVRAIAIFSELTGGIMLYKRVLAENENYHDGGAMEYTVNVNFVRT